MKLDVWNELAAMERRMDDLVRSFIGQRARLAYPVLPLFVRGPYVPTTDVFARGGDLVVRLELPGIEPKKNVTVTVEDGDLVIRGERKQKEEVKEEAYYRMEAIYGAFERRIPIPEGAEDGKISAEYSDGILEVVVPGAAEPAEQPVVQPTAKPIPIRTAKAA